MDLDEIMLIINDKDKLIMENLVAKQPEGCQANLSRPGSQ
jgi:hypothetical protein